LAWLSAPTRGLQEMTMNGGRAAVLMACAFLASVFWSAAPSFAENYPKNDPREVVASLASKIMTLPSWADASFRRKLDPYLTDELISAIEAGLATAQKDEINLYDAELFTGIQGLSCAKLIDAKILRGGEDKATVAANIAYDGDVPRPAKCSQRMIITFELKRLGSAWKIDDVENAERKPSIKAIFLDPKKYGS
jgi:hypothetical protein